MYIPISECKIVFKTIHGHVYETLDLQSFKYMYTDVSMYMEFNPYNLATFKWSDLCVFLTIY